MQDWRLAEEQSKQLTLQKEDAAQRVAGRQALYRGRDLTSGSISRNLWFLAWPQMAESVLNIADQVLDLVWAGRLGAHAIAGLGVAQSYVALVMTGRMGFDTASRAMISRAVGARDIPFANHIALQGFTLSSFFSIVIAAIGVLLTEWLLRLLGLSDAVVSQGAAYMRVQLVGQVTIAFRMMSSAALQASGDAVTPLKATTLTRIVHVVLSPFLIFGWWLFPELGLAGAAWATVLAQLAGATWNFHALFTGKSLLRLSLRGYRLDFRLLWRIIRIGTPASVTTAERTVAQVILIGLVAPFGDFALAAYSITRRLEMFTTMGIMGLGQASGILAGQNLGAGKPERAKATAWWALAYVMIINVVLCGVLLAFPSFVVSIFNTEPELLAVGVTWVRLQALSSIAMGPGAVLMTTFNTAGDTVVPMLVTLVSIWGVELPFAFALPHVWGLGQYGIAWAVAIAMVVRLVIYGVYFRRGSWLRKKVI